MTEQILNSLFIQNMFLYMSHDEIKLTLTSKEEKIKFVEAVIYNISSSLFFSVSPDRNNSLQSVILYIYTSEEWNKDFIKLLDTISYRCESVNSLNEEGKDYYQISYGTSEAEKRNLALGGICVPTPSEVEEYMYSDYVILKSLVYEKKIADDFNTDQILSALNIMLNNYSALLFENPGSEEVVYDYLHKYDMTSLKKKVLNRKEVKRVKKLIDSLSDYSATKDLAIEVNKELTKDGYFIKKSY